MKDVKWIKITTNMFDDEKIKLIESMPDKDSILIIWIKLLIQAGRTNASSYIFLSENIPYTEEMLATIFNRPLNTIRLSLQTFQNLGMIKIDEKGIFITNFAKYQNLEGMEKIKNQWKLASKKYREKQKELPEAHVQGSHMTSYDGHKIDDLSIYQKLGGIEEKNEEKEMESQKNQERQISLHEAKNQDRHMTSYDGHKIDIDIEEDIDIDKEKKKRSIREKEITVQKSEPSSTDIHQEILDHWNQTFSDLYNPFRLTKKKIDQIKMRLKTFTPEEIKTAITNCHADPSCRGNNRTGWKADWDYLFRNDERIDKYLNWKGGGNNGRNAEHQPDFEELEHRAELERIAEASKRRL